MAKDETMFTVPIKLTDVVYNAASQSFEASATIYGSGVVRWYACSIDVRISTSFEGAAEALKKQALRRHNGCGGLCSRVSTSAVRPRAWRARFDPQRWLQSLLNTPGIRAA